MKTMTGCAILNIQSKLPNNVNFCQNEQFEPYKTYKPVKIIDKKWYKHGIPDEISYIAHNKRIYIILDESLLKDICSYTVKKYRNRIFNGYIHIEGKDRLECYEKPQDKHIISYLNSHFHFYDVYTADGWLALPARKFLIKGNKKYLYKQTGLNMKNIELELDSDEKIQVSGRRIFLNIEHFPIKLKTIDEKGKSVKRVINVHDKKGCVKMMLN